MLISAKRESMEFCITDQQKMTENSYYSLILIALLRFRKKFTN